MLGLLHDGRPQQVLGLREPRTRPQGAPRSRRLARRLEQQVGEPVVLIRERLESQALSQQVLRLLCAAAGAQQVGEVVVGHPDRRLCARGGRCQERVPKRVLRLGRMLGIVVQAVARVRCRLQRRVQAVSQLKVGQPVRRHCAKRLAERRGGLGQLAARVVPLGGA